MLNASNENTTSTRNRVNKGGNGCRPSYCSGLKSRCQCSAARTCVRPTINAAFGDQVLLYQQCDVGGRQFLCRLAIGGHVAAVALPNKTDRQQSSPTRLAGKKGHASSQGMSLWRAARVTRRRIVSSLSRLSFDWLSCLARNRGGPVQSVPIACRHFPVCAVDMRISNTSSSKIVIK